MSYVIITRESVLGPGEIHGPFEDGAEAVDWARNNMREYYWEAIELQPPFRWVAVYLVDRAFGGPEEGGWYYETGVPETHIMSDEVQLAPTRFDDIQKAQTTADGWQRALDANSNAGRPDIGSTLSRGVYRAIVTDHPPEPYPKVKPHYE